jgi:hypothetical protein
MSIRAIKDIAWYIDPKTKTKREPGIYHSYMSSLATTLNYIKGKVDPVWLMGTSAFAFRIFVNEVMCPSAVSDFDWSSILPEAVEQVGYHCIYVSRLWNENEKEQERKEQAHAAVVEAINKGVPAVVWDVADAEWGLIVGYDDEKQSYQTLTCRAQESSLAFNRLGRNGIDILSVAILGEPNSRSREEIIINSLRAAVNHAEQKEWMERPAYENGLHAYDLWALLFQRWAILVRAGKGEKIGSRMRSNSLCYAGHHYSARCYARDYLKTITDGNVMLQKASLSYEKVASFLKPVWDCFSEEKEITERSLLSLAESIKNAKAAEEEGINYIKQYLT